jgi:putative flippase GtrA
MTLARLLSECERLPLVGQSIGYARRHFWQLFRFAAVGVLVAALNVVSFSLFHEVLGLTEAAAVTGMYAVSIAVHFYSHRRFTFRAHTESVSPQGVRYAIMLGVNFLIYQAFVAGAGLLDVSPYVAIVTAGIATPASNFLLMKYFIFAKRERR